MADTNEIRMAIARAWCNPLNASKEMDADIVEAASAEVMAVLNATPQPADAALAEANALADAWQREFGALARALGCLPSSFVGHNAHAIKEAARLRALSQPAAPVAKVPDGVDLWKFTRDVLKRGASIESQFSQQGYETFIAEIEAAARSEHKRLRAMLASAQSANGGA